MPSHVSIRFRAVTAVCTLLAALLLSPAANANGVDTMTFTGLEAAFSLTDDPRSGERILSLLIDSTLFGRGGFAHGEIIVGTNPPDGNRTGTTYHVDPFTIQAVPIPAAVWLFASALLGLAGFARSGGLAT